MPFLQHKVGPLPRWAWIGLGGALIGGGYFYYRNQQDQAAQDATAQDQSGDYGAPPNTTDSVSQADYVAAGQGYPAGYLSLYGYGGSGSYAGYNPSPQQSGPSFADWLTFFKDIGTIGGGTKGFPAPDHHHPGAAVKPPKLPPFPPKTVARAKMDIWQLRALKATITDARQLPYVTDRIDLLQRWIKQHDDHNHHRRHHHHNAHPTNHGAASSKADDHGPPVSPRARIAQ